MTRREILGPLAIAAFTIQAEAAAPQLRESLPASEAIIRSAHAEYVIRFDRPVDHRASRISITADGMVVQTLVPRLGSAVDVLFASGETPPPGRYLLHWETRSPNGEEARGDIPFSVAR
jgi:methionine-rich copper-binding protein CopC